MLWAERTPVAATVGPVVVPHLEGEGFEGTRLLDSASSGPARLRASVFVGSASRRGKSARFKTKTYDGFTAKNCRIYKQENKAL